MSDCIEKAFAPDTITNASPPASVSNYQQVNLKLVDVILEAMGQLNPARATANAGSSSALGIFWKKGRPGQSNMQYEILGSAYGGGNGHDGASGTACHLSNLHVTPIEILESEYPCRITRFDLLPGSGGDGQWRGGLSMVREYELLEDASVVRRFDKSKHPPRGIAGGKDGSGARFTLNLGTAEERDSPTSGKFEMKAGDRFRLQTAAGGGFGDPAKRSPEARAKDVEEGYAPQAKA
jgi:N-methylhydantoinase B